MKNRIELKPFFAKKKTHFEWFCWINQWKQRKYNNKNSNQDRQYEISDFLSFLMCVWVEVLYTESIAFPSQKNRSKTKITNKKKRNIRTVIGYFGFWTELFTNSHWRCNVCILLKKKFFFCLRSKLLFRMEMIFWQSICICFSLRLNFHCFVFSRLFFVRHIWSPRTHVIRRCRAMKSEQRTGTTIGNETQHNNLFYVFGSN